MFFRGTEKIHHLACFWHWPAFRQIPSQVLSINNNPPARTSLFLSLVFYTSLSNNINFWSLKMFFLFFYFLIFSPKELNLFSSSPRPSGVSTRPATRLTIISTRVTQCIRRSLDPSVLTFSLTLYRLTSICILCTSRFLTRFTS